MKVSDTFDTANREVYRPAYHHTPVWGWMNDPNGMFYQNGVWHLYFQYNPYGSTWENLSWGHATSRDLVHWKNEGTPIEPDALGAIFSGSAVVDSMSTAGFGQGAIMAMYTSAAESQTQSLAYSTDSGKTFTKYDGNPVLTATEPDFRDLIDEQLHRMGDLERIISKVAVGRLSPREIVQLRNALDAIRPVKNACLYADNESLKRIGEQLNLCESLKDRIEKEIQPDPPQLISKGDVIADGYNEELDDLRAISRNGKDYLLQIQQRESERTGIPSLKVGFNNVFGYYLEVRNPFKDKVPQEWIRKQTLVQAERYITPELKDYEEKILGADEKILELEARLFQELINAMQEYIPQIQINANILAHIDCLLSFAKVSEQNCYVRPVIATDDVLDIKQGRHPVIETQLPLGERYIPNDVFLDTETQQIMMITGPNMAGKSALLRQTALIVLMAQIGCFVPAESAKVGIVDKIFTRVGASDNISLGESTFMVEMTEAADILNNVTPHSLILFDELGRGTSTYDGISIAWAIVEYLHENPKAQGRTLFATHYHELNEMEKNFPRIKNYNVSVKEVDGKVIFLRKLERGGSEHSFGIHVAEIAGMPRSIVKRANVILKELEKDNEGVGQAGKPSTAERLAKHEDGVELSFFQLDDPVLRQIRDEIIGLDINNLTPVEALNKLNDIKRIVTGRS